ncbi:hypothetical protein L7F22_005331 [Adiantum nelumboides]|nr:hypothetical protein [Adiantum nelumboides]
MGASHNVSPHSLNSSPTLNVSSPTSLATPQSSPMPPRPMPQPSLNENPAASQVQAAKAKRKATKRNSHNIEEVVVDLGDQEDYGNGKDEYYHDRATSIPLSHASSITHDDPMEPGKGESTKEGEKPPLSIASKKVTTPKYEESIAQMADTGKDLLEYLKDLHGCAKSTSCKVVIDFCKAIVTSGLRDLYIRWPSPSWLETLPNEFQALRGIPFVVGAIDGSHIPIIAPRDNHVDYFN